MHPTVPTLALTLLSLTALLQGTAADQPTLGFSEGDNACVTLITGNDCDAPHPYPPTVVCMGSGPQEATHGGMIHGVKAWICDVSGGQPVLDWVDMAAHTGQ